MSEHSAFLSARRGLVLALLLHAALPAAAATDTKTVAPENASPSLAVTVDHGLVSVDVRDALLGDLLRAVGEQAGVRIEIHSGGEDRVTESFAGVGIDEAIRRLARGHDVVLIYGSPRNRLMEVRVYEASAPAAPPVIDPRQRTARLGVVGTLTRQAHQGQPGALASLTSILATDPDAFVRQAAAGALGGFGDAQAASALRAAVRDQESAVRSRAITSLGQMRDQGSVGLMAQALATDPEPSVRRAAAWALCAFTNDDVYRALQAGTSDSDASVRSAAAGALRIWKRRTHTN